MRVLVPRRFIRLGILLAALCLTPAISPPSALAYPRPYTDYGDDPPRGDGDGTVVKGARLDWGYNDTTMATGGRKSYESTLQRYLRLVRMGYVLRWYW